METTSYFSGDFSSLSFYVAWIATAFCCFFAFWIFRSSSLLTIFEKSKSKNNKSCVCCCLGGAYANGSAGDKHEGMPVLVEKQTGASMMEQLVPEIMTHALSYLDYPSLCHLSMMNSWMRKAANDDNAWKVLYRKLWPINPCEVQKKAPTASYQNSLSYHGSAVNVVRFSPLGEQLAPGANGMAYLNSFELICVSLMVGGELIIWKLHSTDVGQTWKVLKSLLFHRKDVLDLQWSTDGAYLVSGSVDNSCIIWDVNKGVAWDPLGHYVASLSSDRTCRVYVNKSSKSKGLKTMNYVHHHVITMVEQHLSDDSKMPSTKNHLFHDETLPSFFRRLAWSPDGSFLLAPAGAYTYEGSGFKATAAQQYGASPFLSGLKSLSSKPFHRVCSRILRTVAGFQLCFSAKTWYGGFLGMMIFGASEVSRNVDLGDQTTMMCEFVVRASDASIIKEIESDLQGWCDDITDGGVEYMPEDEVKLAAAERLRTSMERVALLKAAQPPPQSPKLDEESEEGVDEDKMEEEEGGDGKKKKKENGEDDGKPKGPSTLSKLIAEEAEHRALQAVVLQEWHMLCKERGTKVH